jgi:choline dehydrogenase-like flavoprotein
VFVQAAPDPNPVAPATVEGARSVGIPTFAHPNGRMMEGAGGASISDVRVRDGKRQSVFRSYTFPYMDRPNLTVLTRALVTRLTFGGNRAMGVEMFYQGKTHRIGAGLEVVLSLGAIHTPKVLMQSGKMGRDAMSVVDGKLKVYGIESLRIADGSIMPCVTTGNTMAPCVIIGERAAEVIRAAHQL